MTIPFIDLAWQEEQIRAEREKRFTSIIDTTSFVLGTSVQGFEEEFAAYHGATHAVGVGGGTHALTMLYDALGIGEGDEVITIASTFFASVSSIVHAGARPVLVDIDPGTRNFDFAALECAVTDRTKAVLPVHLYGIPAEMDRVLEFAEKYDLVVIEDACQAHGARYRGKRVGTFGRASAFSFYPGKNLGAYGDGGAVATNDADIAATVRALRNQGCVVKYDHRYLGYNSRLDALQAAVLSAKLPHLDAWNDMRRHLASRYTERLADTPLALPSVPTGAEPVWHLYVVATPDGKRDALIEALTGKGIATGIHYPIPTHLTPALSYLGYEEGSFPHTEALANDSVTLPLYPGMTDDQQDYVIEAIRAFFHG